MKKKLLLVGLMVMLFASIFALSVSAENKIIKLDAVPTLEEIHANPDSYISHLDAFDGNSYGEIDSYSVVVLSDLAEAPTYYVYPSYYYIQSTKNYVYTQLPKLNAAISAADSTAFADYRAIDDSYCGGSCKYLIRFEVPTYVTAIEARAKFESSTNLKELYFPTHIVVDEETGLEKEVAYVTSISGQNLFSSCSSLEYVHNSEFLPAGLVEGNQDGFAGCKKLKEIKIPLTAKSIGLRCFNECASLTEVALPNGLTTLNKMAFANCTSLVTFRFGSGFNKFSSPNNDYETFLNSNKLKYVYLPASLAQNVTATKNQFKNIFNNNQKATFFLVGSYDDAVESKNKFAATEANQAYGKATIVEFDPNINYEGYADTLGYSIIVYNYSACEAFYNGEHNVSEYYTLEYSGEEFLSTATKSKSCANCTYKVDKSEIGALFVCLGYSTNGSGSFVQGYKIDKTQIDAYAAVLGDISFGVVAAGDTREEKVEGVDVLSLENKISHDLTLANHDYFEIKISGITEELYDAYLFVCAYVTAGENTYYINNGVVEASATSVTYNQILEA